MSIPDLIVRGRRVVMPDGTYEASLHIRRGTIERIGLFEEFEPALEQFDAGGAVVMPGLVDTHVHFNEPGRADWEGFESGTRAALAGGVTTVVEMPLNASPPTTTVANLERKMAAAEGRIFCDVGFWGGAVPGNVADLEPLYEAGVFGFKCFLVPSGVPDFGHLDAAMLRETCRELAALGSVLLVHAELPGPIEKAAGAVQTSDPREYATWLASRPRAAENEAILLLLEMARECGTKIHIVHLSSSEALPWLRHARNSGVPVTVETCPHYLALTAEQVGAGATEFKCAPPIRESANREELWKALKKGTIDLVASDHSPSPPGMKCRETGDFMQAWGGVASVELGLPVVWTEAQRRGFSLADVARWMCSAPAQMAGLRQKGAIRDGADADLIIFDPDAGFTAEPELLHFRHKLTPYAGMRLRGVVRGVFLRGQPAFEEGKFAGMPKGRVLQRNKHWTS